MGKITILPDTLCNQIAAGEVVERPAAVVKELMENSIDAGSSKISVALLQGGRKEIRVVDNGSGMSPDDALLALDRHATSKIRTIGDLETVQSLGFRGEALPSIASVSRFELVTREPEAVSGAFIRVEGGIVREVRETGCPAGTMITVRDLFCNVPARRKFLRSIETEMSHIGDQFLRLALAHPRTHFHLTHEGRTQYDFPQTKTMLDRAAQVMGIELTGKLTPFALEAFSMRVHGLVSPPELQRSNGQSLFMYVNGRPVRDRTLHHAVLSAYESLLPRGKFPVVVLCVEVSPALVDVNVHPTKREVRFRNPGEVMEAVRSGLRGGLSAGRAPTGAGGAQGSVVTRQIAPGAGSQYTREAQVPMTAEALGPGFPEARPAPVQTSLFMGDPAGAAVAQVEGGAMRPPGEAGPGAQFDRPVFSKLPIIGQLANSYLLLEAQDGLIIIDQHAAHERIVFDELSSSAARSTAQRLARSRVIELFPREAALLRRWMDRLSELGFAIEPFGGDSFVIQAVPAALSGHSPEELVRGLLQGAQDEDASLREDVLAKLAKTAACHAAVRAGEKLRREEMLHLLESLDRLMIPATCPHGRPLWFKLSHAEIARFFART